MAFSVAPMSRSNPVVYALNVRVAVKPERRAEFLTVIQADAEKTVQTEPGALQFVVGLENDDDDDATKQEDDNENGGVVYHFHEQYRSQSDFDFHCTTPHFREWKDFCDTLPFVTDPVVQFYQCSSSSKDEPVVKVEPRAAFCVHVELCVKPELRQEFLAVIDNNQKGSRGETEPLCLQYDFGESTATPNTFYFHEQYTGADGGREGFEAHRNSPHFAKWEEFASKDPFTSAPVVNFFKSIV